MTLSIAQNQAAINASNNLKQNPFTVTDPWQKLVIGLWSIGERKEYFEKHFNKAKQEGYDEELILWFYDELNKNYSNYLAHQND